MQVGSQFDEGGVPGCGSRQRPSWTCRQTLSSDCVCNSALACSQVEAMPIEQIAPSQAQTKSMTPGRGRKPQWGKRSRSTQTSGQAETAAQSSTFVSWSRTQSRATGVLASSSISLPPSAPASPPCGKRPMSLQAVTKSKARREEVRRIFSSRDGVGGRLSMQAFRARRV